MPKSYLSLRDFTAAHISVSILFGVSVRCLSRPSFICCFRGTRPHYWVLVTVQLGSWPTVVSLAWGSSVSTSPTFVIMKLFVMFLYIKIKLEVMFKIRKYLNLCFAGFSYLCVMAARKIRWLYTRKYHDITVSYTHS